MNNFNPFFSMTKSIIALKNVFIITQPIFYRQNEKIMQYLNALRCIDYHDNDSQIP